MAKKGTKLVRARGKDGRIIPTDSVDKNDILKENQDLKHELLRLKQENHSLQTEMEGLVATSQIKAIRQVFSPAETKRFMKALLRSTYKWQKDESGKEVVIGIRDADLANIAMRLLMAISPRVKQIDVRTLSTSSESKKSELLAVLAKIGRADPDVAKVIKDQLAISDEVLPDAEIE